VEHGGGGRGEGKAAEHAEGGDEQVLDCRGEERMDQGDDMWGQMSVSGGSE